VCVCVCAYIKYTCLEQKSRVSFDGVAFLLMLALSALQLAEVLESQCPIIFPAQSHYREYFPEFMPAPQNSLSFETFGCVGSP